MRSSTRSARAQPRWKLASAVTFAAATRIARFPTSNEFGDWDTALHTFTFANAVEQGLRRSSSVELLRGVLDAAISVHLDRFLNVPAKRLPAPEPSADPEALLTELPRLLDRQQQVDEAGQLVASYLGSGGDPARLVAALGAALCRENRNFHTIQCVEAAVRQHELLAGTDEAGASPACRGPLPRRARDDDPLAAPDVRHRPPPPPRREALRGRGRLGQREARARAHCRRGRVHGVHEAERVAVRPGLEASRPEVGLNELTDLC